jgi:hypothetical protein
VNWTGKFISTLAGVSYAGEVFRPNSHVDTVEKGMMSPENAGTDK